MLSDVNLFCVYLFIYLYISLPVNIKINTAGVSLAVHGWADLRLAKMQEYIHVHEHFHIHIHIHARLNVHTHIHINIHFHVHAGVDTPLLSVGRSCG